MFGDLVVGSFIPLSDFTLKTAGLRSGILRDFTGSQKLINRNAQTEE